MKFIQECSGAWARKEDRGFVGRGQGENLAERGSEMGDSHKHLVWVCLQPLPLGFTTLVMPTPDPSSKQFPENGSGSL